MKKKTFGLCRKTCWLEHRDVEKGLFSDESSVNQFFIRRYRIWRRAGSGYEEKYTVPIVNTPLAKWYGEQCPPWVRLNFVFCRQEQP